MSSLIKSRYEFSLNTAHGVTDEEVGENYYDQVVAMSQGIINTSFKKQFAQIKGINKMMYDGEDDGMLDAVLNAPTIILNADSANATEVLFQLRIKSGSASAKIGGVQMEIPLNDWVLSIRTKLNEVSLDIAPGDTPGTIARKLKWQKDIKAQFPKFVAGDYRVQRVYAALAGAPWIDPDGVLSTVGQIDPKTNKPMTFDTWRELPENSDVVDRVLRLIQSWAKQNESRGISKVGIKFELTEEKMAKPFMIPTFRPVRVLMQVYPYRFLNEQGQPTSDTSGAEDYTTTKEKPRPDYTKGDYNCLLYCENVDRTFDPPIDPPVARAFPPNTKLSHSGNLTQPTAATNPEIMGTFILDHRVFLKTWLLPHLQELCLANQFQVDKPEHFMDTFPTKSFWGFSSPRPNFRPHYAIGTELTGHPKGASDPYFAFKQDSSNVSRWVWNMPRSQQSINGNPYKYPGGDETGYNDYHIFADSWVEVMWKEGEKSINIKGEVKYDYRVRYADNSAMTDRVQEKYYLAVATWSFGIELQPNGVSGLKIHLIGVGDGGNANIPDDLKVELPPGKMHLGFEGGDTQGAIKRSLEYSLSCALPNIKKNIIKAFQTKELVYPGHGELEFTDPRLTKAGDVIAIAMYKEPSGEDGSMYFPEHEPKPAAPATVPEPGRSKYELPPTVFNRRKPKLFWDVNFVPSKNKDSLFGQLTLKATNKSGERVGFGFIKITLLRTDGTILFNSTGSVWENRKKSILDKCLELVGKGVKFFFGEEEKPLDPQKEPEDKTPKLEDDKTGKPADKAEKIPVKTPTGEKLAGEKPTTPTVKPEPPQSKPTDVFGYSCDKDWESEPISLTVETMKSDRTVEATIRGVEGSLLHPDRRRELFEVDPGKSVTVTLQGKVEQVGKYLIKIHEACRDTDDPSISAGSATHHQLIEIKENGTVVINPTGETKPGEED